MSHSEAECGTQSICLAADENCSIKAFRRTKKEKRKSRNIFHRSVS